MLKAYHAVFFVHPSTLSSRISGEGHEDSGVHDDDVLGYFLKRECHLLGGMSGK